jgi:hypothetical protein
LRLLPINSQQRKIALDAYHDEWLAGMAAEPVEHKKQNAGRFRANTWLRKYSNRIV